MIYSNLLYGDFNDCKNPELSILIPTFRNNKYLYEAIDSAISLRGNIIYEVIVVSNNPDTDLTNVINHYAYISNLFIYQNKENIGMVNNSNRCAELARGKYVAFLHDDDYLHDNYLDVVQDFINKNECCLITGRRIKYEGKILHSEKIKDVMRKLYFVPNLYRRKYKVLHIIDSLKCGGNIYLSPSCGTLIRKEAFTEIGGFDSNIAYSFDWDFFLKFNLKYKVIETTEICATYRVADNASSRSEVIREFFNYTCNNFIQFLKDNHIDDNYLKKHENDIIYNAYMHAKNVIDLDKEVIGRKVSRLRWLCYRIMTLFYYYSHNLDIQRL